MAFWSKKSTDDTTAQTKSEPVSSNHANGALTAGPQSGQWADQPMKPQPPVDLAASSTPMPPVAASVIAGQNIAGQQPASQPQQLSAQEAQKREVASRRLLLSFGKIVSVLMRSPQFRAMPLAEVEAMVVPAIVSGQFLIADAQSKANGFVTPVAVALWANVSQAVDQRLSENLEQPLRLAPNEWTSGDITWLVAIAGDSRVINAALKQHQETTLKGRALKMRGRGKDGVMVVGRFVPAVDPPATAAS